MGAIVESNRTAGANDVVQNVTSKVKVEAPVKAPVKAQQCKDVPQKSAKSFSLDWRPFVFGGVGSVAAEMGED